MDVNLLINEAIKLSEQIQSKEPPAFTDLERQSAITMANIDRVVTDLIVEEMSPKIIVTSMFYFWLKLETSILGMDEKEFTKKIELLKMYPAIIKKIRGVIAELPDTEEMSEKIDLGNKLDLLKSFITIEYLEPDLPQRQLISQTEKINTRVYGFVSELLMQNFHPMIISNILFTRWVRLSTLHDSISEKLYQKIEYYISDVTKAVRKYIPSLFG
jgi:hypothetical protein